MRATELSRISRFAYRLAASLSAVLLLAAGAGCVCFGQRSDSDSHGDRVFLQ